VTTNLAAALKYVRGYWEYEFPGRDPASFRIWADALCIDQSNTQERGEQVQLMSKIYTMTSLVLGWLGEEANIKVALAGYAIKVLGDAFRSRGWDPVRLSTDLSWLTECKALIQEPMCDELWNSLEVLANLPYWKRTWILQENVLAPTVFYITPNAMIEQSALMNVCRMFYQALDHELTTRNTQKPEFVPDHIWFKFKPPAFTGFTSIQNIARFGTISALYAQEFPSRVCPALSYLLL
jgi:hypothetical protein